MKKHICKNCGHTFEYCRGCLLSPILYKDEGYCSKTCYEESKTPKIEEVIPVVDVEVVVIDEDTSTSQEEVDVSSFFSATEELTTKEDIVSTSTNINYKKKRKNKNKQKYKENIGNDNK